MFEPLHIFKLVLDGIAIIILTTLIINSARGLFSRFTKHRVLHSVPGPARSSLLAGNLLELFDAGGLPFYESLAQYGGVAKLHGLFGDIILAISDPRALSHVLVKEPYTYPAIDISGTLDSQSYAFGPGLLSTNGSAHKKQRKMLNPVFSASHVRRHAPLVYNISRELRGVIEKQVISRAKHEKKVAEVEVAEWLGRASLEMISQAGFGHTFKALQGEGGTYLRAVKELIPTVIVLGPLMIPFVMSGASSLPPALLKVLGKAASLFIPPLANLMNIVDTMYKETRDIWEARKAEIKASGVDSEESAELLSVLLGASGENCVPDVELCAQATTLVFAGTETTSTALCRVLHLLALHPHIQDRLRAEINTVVAEDFQYDRVAALPFLDAVIKETLRVYAPFPFRNRRSAEDSVIPFADGTSVHVPAGTEILVNLHGLNVDTHTWGTDAHVWRPERWLEPLPATLIETKMPGVYPNSMTFLGGSKACIGFNFTIVEMKTVVAVLLASFSFALPTEYDIEWRFGPLVTPSVKGEKGVNPKMPLRVEILDGVNAHRENGGMA